MPSRSRRDATICTSLVEARFLTGSANLYEQFSRRFEHRPAVARGG